MKMTKAQVRKACAGFFATWRYLPENANTDDQKLHFFDFYRWLEDHHPEATKFRSVMGPKEDIEL